MNYTTSGKVQFYYLKDGKVVNSRTGRPADQEDLISIYYPEEGVAQRQANGAVGAGQFQAKLILSPEQQAVEEYALQNSFRPNALRFDKWFPARKASPKDSNSFEVKFSQDWEWNPWLLRYDRVQVSRKVMTADRVVRVIQRTDTPILGPVRTDNFYYLKGGKVVKSQSGTPADVDELIAIYYPGQD